MDLESDLLALNRRSESALTKCRIYLRSHLSIENGDLVYTAQPDLGPPFLGTYGASCAALGLLAAGTSPDDLLVRELVKYLCAHQMESGGWTIRNASSVGLTTACAFSLMAFAEAGVQTDLERRAVTSGIDWLLRTSTSRGWPFFEGGPEIAITPTALAVRALRQLRQFLSPSAEKALDNGCNCIERAFRQDGSIPGRADDDAGCRAATSVALITLVECDYPLYSDVIVRGQDWLRRQTDWPDDNSDSFNCFVVRPGVAGQRSTSAHVNYVHFTSALMLQALLACGTEVADTTVCRLASSMLDRQKNDGDWQSPLAPKETPTWMDMDATLALVRFSKAFVAIRPTLRIRGELARVDSQTRAAVDKLAAVSSQLQSRLKALEALMDLHQQALLAFDRIVWLTRLVFLFVPLPAVIIGYVVMRARMPTSTWVTDSVGWGVGIVLSVLSLLPLLRVRAWPRPRAAAALTSVPSQNDLRGPIPVLGAGQTVSVDERE
jgi:hypothetical protein